MNGTLKSFSTEKQFGFIKGDDGNDYFFHASALKYSQDINKLFNGAFLSFECKATPKGYSAYNISLNNNISVGYTVPDSIYTSKSSTVNGWEVVESSDWIVHGTSRNSPDSAKDDMLVGANNIGANCLLNVRYYKTTGSEAGTGRGTHYYTIHNFCGSAVNIAKKTTHGKYKKEDFRGLNDRANTLKSELILKTSKSSNTKLISWTILLAIVFITFLVNQGVGMVVGFLGIVLGLMIIRSVDYDSWLEHV